MSDNLYENLHFGNEEENTTEKPIENVSQENAAPAEPIAQETAEVSEQPERTEVYSDSSFLQGSQAEPDADKVVTQQTVPYGNPDFSQPQSQPQPYVDPYQPAQSNAPDPAQESVKPQNTYNDGFYHQSYQPHTSGAHVNYTRPVGGYVTPGANPNPAQQPYTAQQPYGTRVQVQPPRKKEKKSGMSKGAVAALLIVCVLLSGVAGFGGSMLAQNLNKQNYSASGDTMVIHKVNTEAQVAGTETLTDKTTSEIASEVADSVVEITTEVMQTSSYYGQYIAQGAGSGVIISDDGYILTNNHVIDGASSIKVTTRSGDTYDAKLQGTDAKVDIALLKIDAKDLPTAVFGDSDTLEVGSKAVIIGNPLGTLGGSVTEGIISALDRSIDIDGKTMHLIQTDASVNPGNSGGGMFNGQGELTGIVVAKSASEEIDNIGFVIPINNVLDILGNLKDYGYVRGRADTGMDFIDLSNQMYAWYYYGNNETGVYISSVDNGSSAEEAGFRKGDRVVSIDGKEITSSTEIETLISDKSAGDKVSFVISRGGKQATIELTLIEEIPESVQGTGKSNSSSNSQNGGGNSQGGGFNPFSEFFGR